MIKIVNLDIILFDSLICNFHLNLIIKSHLHRLSKGLQLLNNTYNFSKAKGKLLLQNLLGDCLKSSSLHAKLYIQLKVIQEGLNIYRLLELTRSNLFRINRYNFLGLDPN